MKGVKADILYTVLESNVVPLDVQHPVNGFCPGRFHLQRFHMRMKYVREGWSGSYGVLTACSPSSAFLSFEWQLQSSGLRKSNLDSSTEVSQVTVHWSVVKVLLDSFTPSPPSFAEEGRDARQVNPPNLPKSALCVRKQILSVQWFIWGNHWKPWLQLCSVPTQESKKWQ